MTDQQNIFDEKLIDIRKKRVKNNFSTFIHDLAISDLKDRLLEIGNECLEILIVGHFAKYWSNNLTIKKTKYIKENKFLNILPRSQDLIISALHLHSANDPISKLVQMRFGLKTNGIFLGYAFGNLVFREFLRDLCSKRWRKTYGILIEFSDFSYRTDLYPKNAFFEKAVLFFWKLSLGQNVPS